LENVPKNFYGIFQKIFSQAGLKKFLGVQNFSGKFQKLLRNFLAENFCRPAEIFIQNSG